MHGSWLIVVTSSTKPILAWISLLIRVSILTLEDTLLAVSSCSFCHDFDTLITSHKDWYKTKKHSIVSSGISGLAKASNSANMLQKSNWQTSISMRSSSYYPFKVSFVINSHKCKSNYHLWMQTKIIVHKCKTNYSLNFEGTYKCKYNYNVKPCIMQSLIMTSS